MSEHLRRANRTGMLAGAVVAQVPGRCSGLGSATSSPGRALPDISAPASGASRNIIHAELAVGLMLLAASPGGATANIYSHLARGDVALNITLTAVNSVLCLLTLPLILNLSLAFFLGSGQYVPPPVQKIIEVAVIILLPVAFGMLVRARAPAFAARMEKPIRLLSVLVLVLLIVAAVAKEWRTLLQFFASIGIVCLLFNLASMATGYAAPRALKLPRKQAIAIAMEIGIHNGTLAIFIALNVLQNATMSIPAAVYSLLMFFTAAAFAWFAARRGQDGDA